MSDTGARAGSDSTASGWDGHQGANGSYNEFQIPMTDMFLPLRPSAAAMSS